MNFLAHLYLSGESDGIKTGNFIGDYVKGKNFERYEGDIRKGILMHRSIDAFTDKNIWFREASRFFSNSYHRYSGIVTDVVFDHLLAKHWEQYSLHDFRAFTRHAHRVLLSDYFRLPSRVRQFLPVMIRHRRLESYSTPEGLEKALRIMSQYTTLPPLSSKAIEVLEESRGNLHELFGQFMNEIIAYAEEAFQVTILRPPLTTPPLDEKD